MAATHVLVVLLCLYHAGVYSWLDSVGFGHKCRLTARTEGDKATAVIDQSCKKGTIEWHYPSFDKDGLDVSKNK